MKGTAQSNSELFRLKQNVNSKCLITQSSCLIYGLHPVIDLKNWEEIDRDSTA